MLTPGAGQQTVILTDDPRMRLAADPATGLLSGSIDAGAAVALAILRIGQLAGIEVRLPGRLGILPHPVTLDGVTAETALNRVGRGLSLIYFHGHGDGAQRQVRTVWVIAEGAAGPAPRPLTAEFQNAPEKPEGPPVDPVLDRAIGQREIAKLSYRGDAAAIAELRETAVEADDPALRSSALSALAGIDPVDSFALFEIRGLRDPSAEVRIEAARSLMRSAHPRGAAVVLAAARREAEPVARDILTRLATGETVERGPGRSRSPISR